MVVRAVCSLQMGSTVSSFERSLRWNFLTGLREKAVLSPRMALPKKNSCAIL